jgi:hypothetical protein
MHGVVHALRAGRDCAGLDRHVSMSAPTLGTGLCRARRGKGSLAGKECLGGQGMFGPARNNAIRPKKSWTHRRIAVWRETF